MNGKTTDTKTKDRVTNANAKSKISISDSNAKSRFNDSDSVAKNEVSATIAGAKPKKRLSGKPFEKGNKIGNRFQPGDDPNRNIHGQRNKEAVRLTTEMRNLYVEVFNEEHENTGMSNLEFGVRRQIKDGVTTDNDAWEAAVNRTWGKSTQPIEVKNDEDDDFKKRMEILFANGAPTVQARDAEIWRIIKSAQRREKEAEERTAKEIRDQGDAE